MSSIDITTAANGSNPFLTQPHWFDDTYQVDELFARLPFVGIDGPTLRVNRIDIPDAAALGNTGAVPVDPNAADGEDLTVAPGDQAKLAYDTLSPASEFWIKRIIGDVDLSSFLRYNFSSQNPQLGHQLAAKRLACRYEYSRMLYVGFGGGQNDPQFLGLRGLLSAAPSQVLTGTGTLPTDVDALISRIRSANGRADYVVMNFNTFALYATQLRAAGTPLEIVPDPLWGQPVPAHQGVPIYRSQFIPDDSIPAPASYSTFIFAGTLGYPNGLVGLYQRGRGPHGMQLEQANSSPDRDNSTTRVSWHASLALLSAGALAAVTETGLVPPTPLQ